MAKPDHLAGPIMRAATGFHHDQRRRLLCHELGETLPPSLNDSLQSLTNLPKASRFPRTDVAPNFYPVGLWCETAPQCDPIRH
jgi:hypothetical protein